MSAVAPDGMDPVAALLARAEIQQLPYRYAYAQDFRDAELLLSLWNESAVAVDPPSIDIHTVREHHQRWFSKGPTVHFVGNHVVDLKSPERATGTVYCWAQLDFGDEFVDQSIRYDDVYVRVDGRWLFQSRRHLLWFGQRRAENPIAQPPSDWPRTHYGRGELAIELLRSRGSG